MNSLRKLAVAAGVSYLITHVTSVPALILYQPVLNNANYVVSSGNDTSIILGAFLEIITAFAIIGTAVTLFPIVKKQNEAVALGYVGLRTLEAGIIVVGAMALLAVVALRQQIQLAQIVDGSTTTSLVLLGQALVAFHNWTFLLGPGFTSGTNTILMAYLMYRSRLVPRFIPILGLIGGPLEFGTSTAVLFGLIGQYSAAPGVLALPEFAWELTLALYLILKGFRPSTSGPKVNASDMHQ